MIPLPLVLEPTAHYLLLALPLGGSLIAFGGYLIWQARRLGWSQFGPRQWGACAVMGALGGTLLVQPVGWRFSLDRDGLSLSAPFDLSAKTGEIRWEELQTIRFGWSSGRHATPTVEFVGRTGTALAIQVPEGVPDAYWPVLIAVIRNNAPDFRFTPDADRWLANVRAVAEGEYGTLVGWTYTAHDGEGRQIR